MSAHGGGAWKVAYADFVTAMMAFFLVMWICAQDQKIKQAIARYFVNPAGILPLGASKEPDRTGALFPFPSSGRGRATYSPPKDAGSVATKTVSDWIRSRGADGKYWSTQVDLARNWARMSNELLHQEGSVEQAAAQQLSRQLKDTITRNALSDNAGLPRELLAIILSDVNWTELAEDLLADHAAPE
jgi:flagellar motor protein MotB